MNKSPSSIFGIVQDDIDAVEKELYSVIQSPVDLVNDIGVHLIQAGVSDYDPLCICYAPAAAILA